MAKETIELKSGLEIHQQLDTKKLFCNCPGILRRDSPDYKIERKLHVVAGESGEIDEAVKHEASKEKTFIYECYYDNCCLVELDECPPYEINQEALKIALQVSLLLNCEILQNSQIMRKTVIDGSNVSGFQRTVLIARKGYLETKDGRVGIDTIALEEDAARIIKKEDNKAVYRLDRLGIPLIEIATSPDIKNAKQAREVALHLGEILRACKVKRGLGTIRQDVNMSIKQDEKWGKRVEIKGVQEPDLIEKTILTETERQKKLIKHGKSIAEVRNAEESGETTFLRPLPGASRMYPETDLPLLHISRDLINEARVSLPRMKSELRDELKNKGLHPEMIKLILEENKLPDFLELSKIYKNADLIAKMLTLWQKEISSKNKISEAELEKKLTLDILETILQALEKGKVAEPDVKQIIEEIAKGSSIEKALQKEKIENVEEEILRIIKEKPGLNENAYMGLVMAKFKGKISGKEAMGVIKRVMKK